MIRKSKFNFIKLYIGLFICFMLLFYSSFYYTIKHDNSFFIYAEDQTSDPQTTDAPGETAPQETEPVVTDPGETDPGETDPGETDPGQTDPGQTDPGETNPGETDPNGTPGGTAPEKTEPNKTSANTSRPQGTQTPHPVETNGEAPNSNSPFTRRHTPINSAIPDKSSFNGTNSGGKGIIVIVKVIGYIFFAASFFMAVYAILYAIQSLFPKLIKVNIPRLDDIDSSKSKRTYSLDDIMDKPKKNDYSQKFISDIKNAKDIKTVKDISSTNDIKNVKDIKSDKSIPNTVKKSSISDEDYDWTTLE